MKRLTTKQYWDRTGYSTAALNARSIIPKSFATVHLHHLLRQHLKRGQKVIEIGVAPGIELIQIAKDFEIIPYGVDYSRPGVTRTRNNFIAADLNSKNVFYADIFSPAFQRANASSYEIVLSMGFVEHFDNVNEAINAHLLLLKPGGVLIITIPNLKHNHFMISNELLRIHNLSIMDPDALASCVPRSARVIDKGYLGGAFNLGLYFFQNRSAEFIRLFFYGVQRLTIDQVQRLLLRLGIVISSRRCSPSIYVVARKK